METIIKTLNLTQQKTAYKLLGLSAVLFLVPITFSNQWLIGSLANASFIISLFILKPKSVWPLAFIPSLSALSVGLLPIILAPAIPLIIIANLIFIFSFYVSYKSLGQNYSSYWLALFISASLKFIFLSLAWQFVNNLLDLKISNFIVKMLNYPQFYTAFIGGIIAYILIFKLFKNKGKNAI
ncbi:MAG: hypothetical protein K9M44_01390 [Candidatus Pacebacteria bacterium]|nr:hypothetical protein [Candidatus Paceibacterota bacterium]